MLYIYSIRSRTEEAVTGLTRNQFTGFIAGTRVRIPPTPLILTRKIPVRIPYQNIPAGILFLPIATAALQV